MIEFYLLFALILNIIADLMIWREVKVMRIAHQVIMVDTQGLKITMDQASIGFKEFSESLGPALTDHAKMTAKALGSAIGYYQGKAQKAAEGETGELQNTLQALAPLANMISQGQTSKSGDDTIFHV